jgi:hypothetical protein
MERAPVALVSTMHLLLPFREPTEAIERFPT